MKKFRFRLQALLKVREHLERERQKEHGAAVRKVLKQQAELHSIDETRALTREQQCSRMVGNLSVAEMLVYSRYLIKLRRDQAVGGQLLHVLEREAEQKRLKLLEASKQKKIYEKLKERHHQRFNVEVARLERKDSDEAATTGHRRKKDQL